MNTIKLTVGTLLLTLALAVHSSAIEGLQISVQCSNVVLSWPSVEGETYIVQYRPDLGSTNSWTTLTNNMPAEGGTNLTFFVHSNIVQNPVCDSGSMGMMNLNAGVNSTAETASEPDVPMAMRADGTGSAVPLALYPEGFDLSGFVIFDPLTGESVSGAGYSRISPLDGDIPLPEGGEGAGGSTNAPPETGFYRVVRNGPHLFGITNDMTFSGVVTIPVEVCGDIGTLASLSIDEDGSPVDRTSVSQPPFTFPLSLTIDTTQMSNGVHQIYVTASWYIAGSDHPYIQVTSTPITVNVSNEISFPNWMPEFGQLYNSLYINAQSVHTDADWYIDVYGANAGYIGTFGGHTYDGNIDVVWNLIGPPPESITYTNEPYFQFAVEVDYDNGESQINGPKAAKSASTVAPISLKNWDKWAVPGDWVVGNQLYWELWVGGENLNTMTDGFEQMATTFGLTVRPNHNNAEAFRIHYGDSSDISSWQAFRDAIYHPNSRNLFYSGHGGDGGIGFNTANTNLFIPQSEIESMLHTVPAGQTNRHGFRFVFLDGCETANGHLAEAFGVVHKKNLSHTYYDNAGLRRTAFVGWNEAPTAGYASHLVDPDHWKFVQNSPWYWTTGHGIREALDLAVSGGTAGQNDIDPDDLTVYGCSDLGPNQQNGL